MDFTADIIEQIEQAQAAADDIVVAGRDRPLDFHWRVPTAAAARTGWQASGDRQTDAAMLSVMAALVLAGRAGEWVSYSRRREWYRGAGRYHGLAYTYDRILGAVDELLALGLVEEQRARPGDHRRTQRQSRMRATDKLLTAFSGIALEHKLHETIRLRDERGDLVDYRDTAATVRMRRDMECLNRSMTKVKLELPGEGVVIDGHLLRVDGATVRMTVAPSLYRVFNQGSFNKGGRIYWWGQNLPASRRADLRIDGQPVVELDYQSLHPRMLYARRGAVLDFDPYAVPDFPRKRAKRALLVALNAPHIGKAVAALLASVDGDGTAWPYDWPQTRCLVDSVIARNPTIAEDIGADVGIGLMHEDSELALRVVKACAKLSIACLPVHDSFIVQARHEAVLREIMAEEMERYEARARTAFETSKRAAEKVIENSVPNPCEKTVIRPGIPHAGVWGVGGGVGGSDIGGGRRGRDGSADEYIAVIDCRTRPSYDKDESERRQAAFERGETKQPIRVPGEMEHMLWPLYGRDVGRFVHEFFRSEQRSWESFNGAWRIPIPIQDPWYEQERKRRRGEMRRSQVAQDGHSALSSMR